MPSGIDKNTVVELKGEFEEGSDGSDVNMSMGMAVAVGVTVADNSVEIKGDRTIEYEDSNKKKQKYTIEGAKVTTGAGISMLGISNGSKAITQAKSGFNQGNTGVAGALAVQVALVDTDHRREGRRDQPGGQQQSGIQGGGRCRRQEGRQQGHRQRRGRGHRRGCEQPPHQEHR